MNLSVSGSGLCNYVDSLHATPPEASLCFSFFFSLSFFPRCASHIETQFFPLYCHVPLGMKICMRTLYDSSIVIRCTSFYIAKFVITFNRLVRYMEYNSGIIIVTITFTSSKPVRERDCHIPFTIYYFNIFSTSGCIRSEIARIINFENNYLA